MHAAAGAVVLRGRRRLPVPELRHVGALGEPARQAARTPPPARDVVSALCRARGGGEDDDDDDDDDVVEAPTRRAGVAEAEGAHSEVGAGESSDERRATEEEQLLYRVPIFDPALGEFCSPPPIDDAVATASGSREDVDGAVDDTKEDATVPSPVQELPDCFASFGPTDAEHREFAADMEALLGQGLDDSSELGDSFYMEALGLISPAGDSGRVKVEADGGPFSRSNGVLASGPDTKLEFNRSPPTLVDDDDSFEHKMSLASNRVDAVEDAQFMKRSLDLRLNYEAVIESWARSPWTDGQRPHGQLHDLLLHDHSGMWTAEGGGRQGEAAWTPRPRADGWREARVSRYREKRRTRLFAKKIRYEVRKLNAEKRPRMKGRFVKRSGAALAAAALRAVT